MSHCNKLSRKSAALSRVSKGDIEALIVSGRYYIELEKILETPSALSSKL